MKCRDNSGNGWEWSEGGRSDKTPGLQEESSLKAMADNNMQQKKEKKTLLIKKKD